MKASYFFLATSFVLYLFECWRVRTVQMLSSVRYVYAVILIFSVTLSFLFSIFPSNASELTVVPVGIAVMSVLFAVYFLAESS